MKSGSWKNEGRSLCKAARSVPRGPHHATTEGETIIRAAVLVRYVDYK